MSKKSMHPDAPLSYAHYMTSIGIVVIFCYRTNREEGWHYLLQRRGPEMNLSGLIAGLQGYFDPDQDQCVTDAIFREAKEEQGTAFRDALPKALFQPYNIADYAERLEKNPLFGEDPNAPELQPNLSFIWMAEIPQETAYLAEVASPGEVAEIIHLSEERLFQEAIIQESVDYLHRIILKAWRRGKVLSLDGTTTLPARKVLPLQTAFPEAGILPVDAAFVAG